MNELEQFYRQHQEVINEITGLTQHILRRDLEKAVKYNRGYYKNNKGEYLYLKGIEVTNNIADLGRMGFNGEDRGVWVHYSSVKDRVVTYRDVPIVMFTSKFDPMFTPEDELMRPTTKEDFEDKVAMTIKEIISNYNQKREPQEYLDVLSQWDDILNKSITEIGNRLPTV